MKIRDLTLNDLRLLEGSQNGFQMPNVCNPLYFSQITLTDDEDEVIVAALTHLTTEVSLIFRIGVPDYLRAKALTSLFEEIKRIHYASGLEDAHVFLTHDDGRFEHLLKKLGFVRATGTPMYYQGGTHGKGTAESSNKSSNGSI